MYVNISQLIVIYDDIDLDAFLKIKMHTWDSSAFKYTNASALKYMRVYTVTYSCYFTQYKPQSCGFTTLALLREITFGAIISLVPCSVYERFYT